MIIIKSNFKELNHVWIPPQHHRNVSDWQGIKCTSKDQTSSLYWTAAKSGFFVFFHNVFALMVKWTWEVPSLSLSPCFCHGLQPSPLCQGGRGFGELSIQPQQLLGIFLPTASSFCKWMWSHNQSDIKELAWLQKLQNSVIFVLLLVLKSNHFRTSAQGEVAKILVSYWQQDTVIWDQFKRQIFHILKP